MIITSEEHNVFTLDGFLMIDLAASAITVNFDFTRCTPDQVETKVNRNVWSSVKGRVRVGLGKMNCWAIFIVFVQKSTEHII